MGQHIGDRSVHRTGSGQLSCLVPQQFPPVKVLKGMIGAHKGGSFVRKALVTFQFVISIFLITSTIVLYLQVRHVERPAHRL